MTAGWVTFNWQVRQNHIMIENVDHLWAVLYYPGEGWGIQRDRVHPTKFFATQPECKLIVEKEILSGIDPCYN